MERSTQFVGSSLAFLDAVERASRAAPLNRPVLVIGERGTGKELIAERLHHLSGRWAGPLVTMNCAALPENLIEAELFGHEAGSFTGATKTRHGRFEEADGGTLFLDELATLSSPAQDRLLRAVEYGEITRIGASKPIRVDVRIVAATNEHLPRLVDHGRFRADLLDRLSFEVVTLPPLRVRKGDIPLLAEHFGRRMAAELEWSNWPGFSEAAQALLENYGWPGMCANCAMWSNVRSIATKTPNAPSRTSSSTRFSRRGCWARRGRRHLRRPWQASPRGSHPRRRQRPPMTCAARSTLMKKRCSKKRLAATVSISAQPLRRSGLAMTSCATR